MKKRRGEDGSEVILGYRPGCGDGAGSLAGDADCGPDRDCNSWRAVMGFDQL